MADFKVTTNRFGSNVINLNHGVGFDFVLQVPILGQVKPWQTDIEGKFLDWTYTLKYKSLQEMASFVDPLSNPKNVPYYLFLTAHFDGTQSVEDITLNLSIQGDKSESDPHVLSVAQALIMSGVPVNTNMFTIMVSKIVPWYKKVGDWFMAIPTAISHFFTNAREQMDHAGTVTDEWLNKHLAKPAGDAVHDFWYWFHKIMYIIGQIIWDIGYFLVNGWPLWVGIGIVFLIWEVKSWSRERKITKSLSKTTRVMTMKEQAEQRKLQRELEHKAKLQKLEEEHARRLQEIANQQKKKESEPNPSRTANQFE